MATVESHASVVGEVARFLATHPTDDQVLAFRPSEALQHRVRELLLKQNESGLSRDEARELTQFEDMELLMRQLKAELRPKRAGRP